MSIFDQLPKRENKLLLKGEAVWIFGTGSFGRSVAKACLLKGIEVKGFVQTEPTASYVDDLPVLAWSELSAKDRLMALVIGIFNRDTPLDELIRLAHKFECNNIIMPWDFYAQFEKELGWRFWLANPNFIRAHTRELNWVYNRLADETSRKCLERVVNFRLGLGLDYGSFTHSSEQYFNDITLERFQNKNLNYLDGGAFDGDTLKALTSLAEVNQAWLFEPDSKNFSSMSKAVHDENLPGYCLPLGLSDSHKFLNFSGGEGEAARIDHNGTDGITTVAIDDFLSGQNVDFIKLDVEGAEAEVLRGAVSTIVKQKPVLTISCYHHPGDIWDLPRQIDQIEKNYEIYFRQHQYNSFDLVLYGVPK
jgi:FkbM family methyltransferase